MSSAHVDSDERGDPEADNHELSLRAFAALSVAAIAVGSLALVWATTEGIGTHNDSGIYLGTAENIADGKGITVPFGGDDYDEPLSHYPPLYPLVLSVGSQVGLSTLTWATLVNVFAFAVSCGAILVAFRAMLRRRRIALVCCVGAVALSPIVVEGFVYALSEGLFLALGSVWAVLFFRSVALGRPWGLVASGLLLVLASLTRFHGLALLAASSLWIIWRWPAGPRQRWNLGLSYGFLGAAPLLLWVLSRRAEGESGTNREVGWRPIGLEDWNELVTTAVEWTVSARVPYALGVVVTVALVWSALMRHSHPIRDEESFLLVVATAYAAFTVGSRLLLDEAIPFDSRILLPIYPIALALIVLRISTPVDGVDARKVPALLLRLTTAMGLGVAVLMPIRLASWAVQNEEDGVQYAAPEWQQSSLAQGLRELPSGTEVFSNSPPVVYLISNRVSLLGFGEGGLSNELEEALTEASTDVAVAVISSKSGSEVLEDRLSAAGWQRIGDDVASLWTAEEIRR